MSNRDEDHGFRQIGSQALPILNSLKVSDLNQRQLQPNSATTGARSPAQKPSNSTGRELSKTDAGKLQVALMGEAPEKTDEALLALLPPSVASSLVLKTRDFIDPVYGFDTEFDRYELRDAPTGDTLTALNLVSFAMRPAAARDIISELARLKALTKARAEGETDLELAAQAYAEELAEYPPDVIRAACRGWARREKWWPSWAELKSEVDRHVRKRAALEKVLRK